MQILFLSHMTLRKAILLHKVIQGPRLIPSCGCMYPRASSLSKFHWWKGKRVWGKHIKFLKNVSQEVTYFTTIHIPLARINHMVPVWAPLPTNISIQWNVVYPYNKILTSCKKEWSTNLGFNMDEPWKDYAKWKKPNTTCYILYNSIYPKCLSQANP